jgi:hypothetical protein
MPAEMHQGPPTVGSPMMTAKSFGAIDRLSQAATALEVAVQNHAERISPIISPYEDPRVPSSEVDDQHDSQLLALIAMVEAHTRRLERLTSCVTL